ncbi:MFS transporter [Geomicrobium sp. JCM 19038]|uniref:MFS transporter n=1 Tax=Geomicrobium sp. JCM 19038 TaxID=1460635 RepID=UPI00045F2130|nr:MFS transporter [Geomicrobium sp. JCM 19038]GAK08501.1 hypothetical protein JCM19038_2285 [Geomicrobium sp. JCM 19038]
MKRVIRFSNSIRAIIVIVLTLFLSSVSLPILFVLLMLLSIFDLFFLPSSQALVPQFVNRDHRPKANALFQMSITILRIVAQAVSGFVLALQFPVEVLLIAAIVALLIATLCTIKIPKSPATNQGSERLIEQIRAGLREVWSSKQFRMLYTFIAIGMLIATAFELILIHFLTDELHLGVENMAWIGICNIVGITLGAFFAPRLMKRFERKWLLFPPFLFLAVTFIAVGFANSLPVLLPFFVIQGFALGLFQVTTVTLIQEWSKPAYYTRMFTMFFLVSNGMMLPSILISGWLLSTLTITETVAIMATILIVTGAMGVITFPRIGIGGKEETNIQ